MAVDGADVGAAMVSAGVARDWEWATELVQLTKSIVAYNSSRASLARGPSWRLVAISLDAIFDHMGSTVRKSGNHVEPNLKGGWSVRSSGSSRAGKVFRTKDDAVKHGRMIAKRDHSTLYVHGEDGSITEVRSFDHKS